MKLKINLTDRVPATPATATDEWMVSGGVDVAVPDANLEMESDSATSIAALASDFLREHLGLTHLPREAGLDVEVQRLTEEVGVQTRDNATHLRGLKVANERADTWETRATTMRLLYEELVSATAGCDYRKPGGHARRLKDVMEDWA